MSEAPIFFVNGCSNSCKPLPKLKALHYHGKEGFLGPARCNQRGFSGNFSFWPFFLSLKTWRLSRTGVLGFIEVVTHRGTLVCVVTDRGTQVCCAVTDRGSLRRGNV